MNTPIINPAWLKSLGQKPFFRRLAAFAGYSAAQVTRSRDSATRMGTNTNSAMSQMQRLQLSWDGQFVGKNIPMGGAYLAVRQMYCDPKCYMPDTGDSVLDSELKVYLDGIWANGGINCSMWEAFSRSANVEQPCGGDSALVWYRDESQLRLQEVCSDQIGELYQFTRAQEAINGLTYFAGMFFNPVSMQRVGYRIYDRGYNDYYTNAQTYAASDVIYFQDNMFKAVRGITEFFNVINMIYKTDKLFQLGMDSAERQAKVQAVVFNRTGQADEFSYNEYQGSEGELTYVEKVGYGGPVTEFRYTGDDYKLMASTAPGDKLIDGLRYGDEQIALGLRLPYSFLVNAKDVGGASNRLEINKAGHELERIQNKIHRPRLNIISHISILDAVERGHFPAKEGITNGIWQFPNLPIADAFREDKADIDALRSGLKSRSDIVQIPFEQVARKKMAEAVSIHKMVAEGNAQLNAAGLPETITKADIAQDTDQPQLAASVPAEKEPAKEPALPATARFAAYMGDMLVSELPESTQADIAAILGTNGNTRSLKVIKYGMTISELIPMADPANLEAARKRMKYCTNQGCADEVYANGEKHILVVNGRVVDGCHHIVKAERGKVTKSLPVLDLTPARFQSR